MKGALSYAQAEAYLLGTINESTSPRTSYTLERIGALLARLGDPQRDYPIVHVGGTSGKGSTATLIAAGWQASGRRTGLHVKPHLRAMTERARIDGDEIDEQTFAALLAAMLPVIEELVPAHGRATYYETLLALAFLHFARARVDAAVIEVGLGGRLDGTNVVLPEVAVITSVGFDHTEVLGNTLSAIAREKAGIAKPGVPLVTAVTDPEAFDTIAGVAREAGAPLLRVDDHARIEGVEARPNGQVLEVTTARARYHLCLPLLGAFARRNALTAIVALEALPATLRPASEAIERGFARAAIPGRMELVPGDPPVVFDIAHNPEKAAHLVLSLRERFPARNVHFVVAVGASKDARAILRALATLAATFTFTRFVVTGREAVPAAHLARIAREEGFAGCAIDDPHEALSVALRAAAGDDVVVVTGSTFVVANLREALIQERAHVAAG